MSQLDLKIGPKIKAFRRQMGLQANKLAEDLSISPSYLNLIEGGKRKIEKTKIIRKTKRRQETDEKHWQCLYPTRCLH